MNLWRKRAQCCGSAADNGCGSARRPAGCASADVFSLADSETTWLTTFKAVPDFRRGVGGGSDGCVDFSDGDNAGLDVCLFQGTFGVSFADAYESYCTTASLADFLGISPEAVVGVTRQNVLASDSTRSALDRRSQFQYGRTTSTSCSSSDGVSPNPEASCSDVKRVFVTCLGLTWSEAAALMGVHSLGKAHEEFSGYDGWWSSAAGARKFDNDYFIGMVGKRWKSEEAVGGNAAKSQWIRSDPGASSSTLCEVMMLDTDLCLYCTEGTVGTQLAAASTRVLRLGHYGLGPDGSVRGPDDSVRGPDDSVSGPGDSERGPVSA